MRIRKRPQNHLAPAYSSFLPSSLLIGSSATPEALLERGAREREEERLSATGHFLERETGGPRARLLLFSNGDDLLPPPATECISGEFSDLTLHPPPPESAIDGRDLSSHISDFSEAVKREANEDLPLKSLSAEDSSQPKTKRGCNRHSREEKAAKAEEREDQEGPKEEEDMVKGEKTSVVKKRRSPAVLMEGSRCSRVNGRGWRCCQQTLVGYSLCEHHLGKGRLRSVNSVKCNDEATRCDEELESEEKITTTTERKRKKRKIGRVKARSISSLLHQTRISSVAAAPSSSFICNEGSFD